MDLSVGCIDERGYINGFTRRGYTYAKSSLELIANVDDAMKGLVVSDNFKPTLLFDVQRTYTKLIDNASGMNSKNVEDMFAIHRENHSEDTSCGVSGVGAKPAMYILSDQTEVVLFTHGIEENSQWLCITAPWDQIKKQGKYTGMVKIREMTPKEIDEFIQERTENGMMNGNKCHGTTIRFKTNDKLETVIHDNFKPIKESSLTDPMDRIGIVFGKSKVSFELKHYDQTSKLTLKKYNYFTGNRADFYKGISIQTIEQWEDEHGVYRFLWNHPDGETYEIVKRGGGYSKEPEKSSSSTYNHKRIGEYTVKTALRVDTTVFDCENPTEITGTHYIGKYNEEHLRSENTMFLSHYKLVRNEQLIGLIVPPDLTLSNYRAGGVTNLEIEIVQCEISFYPISSQNNMQDRLMGIQENKNQHNGNSIPVQLTRLIKKIKKQHCDEVWNYMKDQIKKKEASEEDVESSEEELEESSDEEVVEPDAKEAVNPAMESLLDLLERVVEPDVEPVVEPLVENVVEAIIEPAVENVVEHAVEQHLEPVDVPAHRKNKVYREEIIEKLDSFKLLILKEPSFTNSKIIHIFNEISALVE